MQQPIPAATIELESHRAPIHVAMVSLRVRDAGRLSRFYQDVVGLEVLSSGPETVLLGNDGIGLLALEQDPQASPAPSGAPGLFHTAFVLPERRHLGTWLQAATYQGWRLEGAADHLVSEAVYLSDPEGNGIEIYHDRPRAEWPTEGGRIRMANARLDIQGLLSLGGEGTRSGSYRLPAGARIGHVHLKVSDLGNASAVIDGRWGIAETCRFPGAAFFGAGGYHHHIAANVWSADGRSHAGGRWLGLKQVTLQACDPAAYADLAARWLADGGAEDEDGVRIDAMDAIGFALRPPKA